MLVFNMKHLVSLVLHAHLTLIMSKVKYILKIIENTIITIIIQFIYLVSFLSYLIIIDEFINGRKRGIKEEGTEEGKRKRGRKERGGFLKCSFNTFYVPGTMVGSGHQKMKIHRHISVLTYFIAYKEIIMVTT